MVHTIRVTMPGKWQDAWLYKDQLFVWDRAGSIFCCPLSRLLDDIARRYDSHIAYLAQVILFRYDWKSSEQFRTLTAVPAVSATLFQPLSEANSGLDLEISPGLLRPTTANSHGTVLDTEIYANRLFTATPEGLYESRVSPNRPDEIPPSLELLSGRVGSVAAKYLALSASLGDAGLWFSPIKLQEGVFWADEPSATSLRKVAEASLMTSFAYRNLLNYIGAYRAELLRAQSEKSRPHDNARFDSWHVTDFESPQDISALVSAAARRPVGRGKSQKVLASQVSSETEAASGSACIVGNSNHRLLLHVDGFFQVVDLAAFEDQEVTARRDLAFASAPPPRMELDEVLETYAFGTGFLVEQFDNLTLFNREGSHVVFNGEAGRIRTFPNATRFTETVAIVGEDCLTVLGVQARDLQDPLF